MLYQYNNSAILLEENGKKSSSKRTKHIAIQYYFITDRVKAGDLRNTTDMPLTLRADGNNIVKWWVYGSYAVHPDMRSQTGGTMSLGKGVIISTSIKQKMNTKSSTETELISVDDLMPHILWKTTS